MSRADVMCHMRGRGKQLRTLAEKINAEYSAAQGHARQALERAAECGRHLIEAKQLVPHGKWLPWLEANTEVGARQSQKYMRLAEGWAEIEANANSGSYLNLSRALELIATPKREAEPAPDPHAVQIGLHWEHALVSQRDFARCCREMRVHFNDDERLKAVLMLNSGAGKGLADRIPRLIEDKANDDVWVDAFLDDLVELVESYEPPSGKKLIHGTAKDLFGLDHERHALAVEAETASPERLAKIIARAHEIQRRSYRIRRQMSEVAEALANFANTVATA